MGCKGRLNFAAQYGSGGACNPAKRFAGGVDHVPFPFHFGWFRHKSTHRQMFPPFFINSNGDNSNTKPKFCQYLFSKILICELQALVFFVFLFYNRCFSFVKFIFLFIFSCLIFHIELTIMDK